MVCDASGNIYIAGSLPVSGQGYNYDIIKLNSNLSLAWERTYNGYNLNDIATGIKIDANSNVYVTGTSSTSSEGKNIVTLKYNSSGTLQWTQTYNDTLAKDDEAAAMAMDATGNIYITGSCGTESDSTNYLTMKYDASGNLLWTIQSDGDAHLDDKATNIAIDTNGNVIVTGESRVPQGAAGNYEYLTIKYVEKYVITPTDYYNESPAGSFSYYCNKGQLLGTNDSLVPEIKYYNQGSSPAFYFKDNSCSFVFAHAHLADSLADTLHRIDLNFEKVNSAAKSYPMEEIPDYQNFFLAQCPEGITKVHGNKRLITTDLYPGIDLMYSSNQNGIKMYFVIKPGGDPAGLQLLFNGASSFNLDSATNTLSINSSIGSLTFERPSVYQVDSNNVIDSITGWTADWQTNGADSAYKFNIGAYDSTKTLVVQVDCGKNTNSNTPIQSLEWSTYFGGSGEEAFIDVANNYSNFVWVGGYSNSPGFPYWYGSYIYNGTNPGSSISCFIAKFDSIAQPKWISYFGGSGVDNINEIVLDDNDNVYVVGKTFSNDFTNYISSGINYSTFRGSQDGFFIVLNYYGFIVCDSYIGGDGADNALGVAVNGSGASLKIAIVGQTDNASNFPLGNASNSYYQDSIKGSNDAFIMRLDNSYNKTWCTLYGGNGIEEFTDIEFQGQGSLIACGVTSSSDPASSHPNNPTCAPQSDGTFPDCICNLSAYSYNQQVYRGGDNDAMIVEFSASDNSLIWSTYFGGSSDENNYGNVISASKRRTPRMCIAGRNLYITGTTITTNSFPLHSSNSNDYYQDYNHAPNTCNIYISKFNDQREQDWCTFFGGNGGHYYVDDICTNSNGNAIFITGNANPSYVASSNNYCVVPYQNEFPLCDYSGSNYMEVDQGGPVMRTFIASFKTSTNSLIWSTRFGYENIWNTNNGISASVNKLFTCGVVCYANGNGPYRLLDYDQNNSNDYFLDILSNGDGHGVISRFNIHDISSDIDENQKELSNILIMPNPANDFINVELPDKNLKIEDIKFFDNMGRLIKEFNINNTANSYKFDLANIKAGLYFIQIRNNQGLSVTGKFIKQ